VLFVWELSFNKWANEALYSSTLLPVEHIYDVHHSAKSYGYTLGREGVDIAVMFLIGVLFRIAGYITLRLTNRDKQN
jgi:hypothetical protein